MQDSIFEIWPSSEEDRPGLVANRNSDFDEASRVNRDLIRNKRHDVESWTPWQLYCQKSATTSVSDWDYYSFGSTSGLFSPRAIKVFGKYLAHCFDPLPANLEGSTYYFLHCRAPIDCLDIDACEISYFSPPNDRDIMSIDRYVFKKNCVKEELIFTIPEQPWNLFATSGIPKIAKQAKVKGLEFRVVDGAK